MNGNYLIDSNQEDYEGSRRLSQWLGVLAALAEDESLVSSPHIRHLMTPTTPD